jgi:hypothetical protein
VGVDVDGLAYPLHRPTACGRQMRGQGCLSGDVLSRRCSGQWRLFGGYEAPGFGYLVECLPSMYLCYQVLHGIHNFYQGMPILCHSHHGLYVFTPCRATMPDSDGTNPSTRV